MINTRCMGYMRIFFPLCSKMVVFVVYHGVFMDLTCLDHMEELHLAIITHRLCEMFLIRLNFMKTPLLFGACMASHLDHLVAISYMV